MSMPQSAAELVRVYNHGREPERLAIKLAAMRANVFSFCRGSAHLFWQRAHEAGIAVTAPAAWGSGDLHLENFGTFLGGNGLAYFDVNDFDEAALAPCDWEITRTLASIFVAAPSFGVNKADVRDLAKGVAQRWVQELALGKPQWIERRTANGAIGELIRALKRRDRVRLLDKRTTVRKGVRRLNLDGGRALPITVAQRADLERFAKAQGKAIGQDAFYRFIDGARRVAGTGSLGVERFVLLIEGLGSPDGNVLLDLKAVLPASIVPFVPCVQPLWPNDAVRVAAVQQHCQAVAPALLDATQFAGKPVLMKELQPTADRLDLARIARNGKELSETLRMMSHLVAWMQLRASGRGGAASADELIAFARGDTGLAARVVATARVLADGLVADYKDFCRDYDATATRAKVMVPAGA